LGVYLKLVHFSTALEAAMLYLSVRFMFP